jgi:hypothetical protein
MDAPEESSQRNSRGRSVLFWVLLGLAIVLFRIFVGTPFT